MYMFIVIIFILKDSSIFSTESDRKKAIIIVLGADRTILQLCVVQHLMFLSCSCL
jgi:hypothetical protein